MFRASSSITHSVKDLSLISFTGAGAGAVAGVGASAGMGASSSLSFEGSISAG